MKFKFKIYLALFLSFTFLFSSCLFATVSSLSTSQKEDLQKYISQFDSIQKNIFTLAQSVVFSDEPDISAAKATSSRLKKSLDSISSEINSSINTSTYDTTFYRDLILLSNAVNYSKASLYELTSLLTQSTPSEKLTTLERYFNFRVYANNSIRFFESLQPNN